MKFMYIMWFVIHSFVLRCFARRSQFNFFLPFCFSEPVCLLCIPSLIRYLFQELCWLWSLKYPPPPVLTFQSDFLWQFSNQPFPCYVFSSNDLSTVRNSLCVDPAFENTISLYVLNQQMALVKFGFSCLKSILLFLNGSINCGFPTGESHSLDLLIPVDLSANAQ